MTTRICIIGDSHSGALRLGWDQLASNLPDFQLTFFAAGGDLLQLLEVSSHCLTVKDPLCATFMRRTSGGLSTISHDYDVYILCGLGFQLSVALLLSKKYRVECSGADGRVPISDECFQCIIEHKLRGRLSIVTLQKLRMITAAPITIVPSPLQNDKYARRYLKNLKEAEKSRIGELAIGAARTLSEENGFTLVLQPQVTLATPITTNPVYGRKRSGRDGHMNGLFGKEMLHAVLERHGFGTMSRRRIDSSHTRQVAPRGDLPARKSSVCEVHPLTTTNGPVLARRIE